jgi:hypothetical protein
MVENRGELVTQSLFLSLVKTEPGQLRHVFDIGNA